MTKTKQLLQCVRGFYRLVEDLLPTCGPYFLQTDGGFLFISYVGDYFYEIPQFDGSLPEETNGVFAEPLVARFEIGHREASEFSEQEVEALRGWVAETLPQVQARIEEHLQMRKTEILIRLEEGKRNREADACEVCKDINDPPRGNFNNAPGIFTCDCGIRYVYDQHLRWWDRKTLAESEHEHAELMDALRYGEPAY